MVTQELIAYVRSELSKGKTREEIRSVLLSSGGWNEVDINEVFRETMPRDNIITPAGVETAKPPKPNPSEVSFISSGPPLERVFTSSSSFSIKHNTKTRKTLKVILLLILLCGLIFTAFYFYKPQLSVLPSMAKGMFSTITAKIGNIIQAIKDKISDKVSSVRTPTPTPIPLQVSMETVNCGTTKSPDSKNPSSYSGDIVLECMGERASACANAESVINDSLFPNLFKIINRDGSCYFELAYNIDSTLVNINGQKLASQSVSCPLSVVKVVDETNPANPVFRSVDKNNHTRYAAAIYVYGTLGLFIENNFDMNKIKNLGCSGTFLSSMIESYMMGSNK